MESSEDRTGAKQPKRFDPQRAALLDDPIRFAYLPPGEVAELLAAPPNATVIDFGTGTGAYAIALAEMRPDLRIVAFDEQPEMLGLLHRKLEAAPLGNVFPEGPDALSSLRRSADRILAINVLHELGDAALRGLAELLAAGGTVLFVDWNADVERPVGPPREHVYGLREARARLEQTGFYILQEWVFAYHYGYRARGPR